MSRHFEMNPKKIDNDELDDVHARKMMDPSSSPLETAQRLMNLWIVSACGEDQLVLDVAKAIEEAVANERELCAKACEGWTTTSIGRQYADGCASRIRARSSKS